MLINLNVEGNSIIFFIEDDGVGFDTELVQSKKSFGILGMKERVRSEGGIFEMASSPGMGTKIIVQLPFSNPANNSSPP